MSNNTCVVDDCAKKNYARGLCAMHDKRLKVWGSLDGPPPTDCELCGTTFQPTSKGKKFCSSSCRRRHYKVNNPNPCSELNCDRPHLAQGLCSMHYKRQARSEGRWNEKKLVACVVCGIEVERHGGGGRKTGAVCSERCRYYLRYGKFPASTELVGPVPKLYGPEPPPAGYVNPYLRERLGKRVFAQGSCYWCGVGFTAIAFGSNLPRYCSDKCKARRYNAKYKKFSIPVRVRRSIYERDGWQCQICFEPTSRVYDHDDIWSPTLDHILPQSFGGTHEPENLRLCHMICNSERGNGEYEFAA